MEKVYYKEVYFALLHPVWFKKFISRIVMRVVTWVQSSKKIQADPYGNLTLAGTLPFDF